MFFNSLFAWLQGLLYQYELWYMNRWNQWVYHGIFDSESEAYDYAKKHNMEISKVMRKRR